MRALYEPGSLPGVGDVAALGAEVRRRRLGAGLSLADLASKAEISPNYIGGIELGKRDPSVSTILALARGLDCHAADLLGGTPELSTPAVEVARLFDEAPIDVQDLTLQMLRKLRKRGPK
jgi:transcriptional regulator with XRE-family HTH domain